VSVLLKQYRGEKPGKRAASDADFQWFHGRTCLSISIWQLFVLSRREKAGGSDTPALLKERMFSLA
jgi:hypothetical protein